MPGYTQRIKGAVLTVPYLLPKLKSQSNANNALIGRIITRLIPYRSSIEIEHMPVSTPKYHNAILSIRHNHSSEKKPQIIDYDCDFLDNNGVIETKISIAPKINDLIVLYKALKTLKSISGTATNGSLHIHINITNWMKKAYSNKLYRCLGIMIIANSGNSQICKTVDNFLTEAGKIFNWVPTTHNFDFKRGISKHVVDRRFIYGGYVIGNVRNIGFESLPPLNVYKLAELKYFKTLTLDSAKLQRRQHGIVPNCGKFNWVNFRHLNNNDFTLEYRLGNCTFDYTEIIQYIIDCNRLTKRFLNYIDKIGQLAIGVDNFASFFK